MLNSNAPSGAPIQPYRMPRRTVYNPVAPERETVLQFGTRPRRGKGDAGMPAYCTNSPRPTSGSDAAALELA